MHKKKVRRFHKDVFLPDWSENSINEYLKNLRAGGQITFSIHAVDKILEGFCSYGILLYKYMIKSLRKYSLSRENIFEFYCIGEIITKACFRHSFEGFPVDMILVISSDKTVITMYLTNKGDNHKSLDANLYERK